VTDAQETSAAMKLTRGRRTGDQRGDDKYKDDEGSRINEWC